ncbi:MAG: triose-phosphate isomerase [Candidatus Nealsonbacteria bacterium CG10_big_fil_rev_8_21_14_0_10_36_24]|uniref:Triosephosphate isomerase n=2 Tax=Candidatus Nealsoniibacteriota TaxID=1817911 RepID=A0A2H0YP62_9BACT|nr:MAG: triose-phosphate isomerase [Candidatus Nealsonbacteria bacterium CG10_big_fil_rev_8_21_14_0_10_36_24]PIS40216.1 MAG: triose-phosphate isomerase [Candidatus Nealsonbacteria bacterium CG08_land_8_20_14_0_20_36_22]
MKISNGVKPLIVANWKCNPAKEKEAKRLFNSVKKTKAVICPPLIYLKSLAPYVGLGAQNCFWEKKGAFTGEVSPAMLKNIGCQYVIVGHSERRRYFNETDEVVNKKLKSVIEARMIPILCIGETQKQRDRGETENILKKQIEDALNDISKFKIQNSKLCIAYEPIWAIGTGKPCDPEEAQKMGLLIRKIISKIYNRTVAQKTPILYGGSVNSKNGASYIKEAGLQGLLVGGASLEAKEFVDLVRKIC